MDTLKHRKLLTFLGLFIDYNEIGLIMEIFQGKTLAEVLNTKDLDEISKNKICVQLREAVHCMHSARKPKYQKDIKPHNILVDKQCNVKLIDYGYSKSLDFKDDLQTTKGIYIFLLQVNNGVRRNISRFFSLF